MEKTLKVIIIILLLYIISLCSFSGCNGKTKIVEIEKTDTLTVTDTIFKTDTFLIEKPIPVKEEIIKVDTFYDIHNVPVYLATETKEYQDTITTWEKDTIVVMSYISGINVQQDSLKVNYTKSEIQTITTIVQQIKQKRKFADRFHIGPAFTFGYDPVNKGLASVIGLGISFDF